MARIALKQIGVAVVIIAALLLGVVVGIKRYKEYKERTNPPRGAEPAPVTVRTVSAEEIDLEIEALANVESTRRYFLYFKTAGRVAMVKKRPDGLPIMPGDRVKKGELLAQLEDEVEQAQLKVSECQMKSAEASLQAAIIQAEGNKKQMDFARKRLASYEVMLKGAVISQQSRDDAEKDLRKEETAYDNSVANIEVARAQLNENSAMLALAQKQLDYTKLIAPLDGIVAYQNIREGDFFSQDSLIQATDEQKLLNVCPIVLIDPDSLWAKAMLLPEEASKVKAGAPVAIADDADPDVVLGSGEVVAIQPARDIRTRMVEVRVKVIDRSDRLVHGALVKCHFSVGKEKVVVVPRDVLVLREGRYQVFECLPSGKVEQREIQVGRVFPNGFELLGGIAERAKVVARGRYRLRDGQEVKVVEDEK